MSDLGEASTGDLDQVLRAGRFAADSAFLDARSAGATGARCVAAAVEAAFACALGNRLIQITDRETWPKFIAVGPPYQPDGIGP